MPSKQAVLLVNLGSPDSPSIPDVRKYLREFLSDERVIDSPAVVRAFVLNFCILPFRPKASAEAYQQIWTPEGSPLTVISERVRELLAGAVDVPVHLAMRYGNPSIPDTVGAIAEDGIESLFLIPLYPQYAMSSYETVVERVREELAVQSPNTDLQVLPPFYQEPAYIDALYSSARKYLEREFDLLLFSFHGVPERHMRKSDPSHAHCLADSDCCRIEHSAHATCYRHQCFSTVDACVQKAGIPADKFAVSFQSRLGGDSWLKPYTDLELERLPSDGVKKLLVICPAFVSDCLETLEEIAIRGRKSFLEAGGKSLTFIPCLNEHPKWIKFLAGKVGAWRRGSERRE